MMLKHVSMLRAAGVRHMSGHSPEHAIAETSKWKKISYAFVPFVCAVTVYVMGTHHHEHHEEVAYPFMKKRNKEYPWALQGGSKCDLFDFPCAEKEKAAKAALDA